MNHLKTGNSFFAQGSYKSYKFLGNELQETGFYDMNARFYMADLGIFGQHDPLSASTLDPYGYAFNNPIMFADPSGLEGEPVNGGIGPGGPQSIGTVTNPIDVGEVVLNAPIKAIANNSGSILPNNCTLCYSGNGASSGINLSAPQIQPTPLYRGPENGQGGGVTMMDSMIWDLAGILIANKIDPEDQEEAIGLGALAIILSRGKAIDDVAKVEAAIAKAEVAAAKNGEQLFEIADGVRRAKAAEQLGLKTINATDNAGKVFQVPLENLRSPLKSSIDVSTPLNQIRYDRIYESMKAGNKLPPIYVNPGNKGITIPNIVLKK
ncbi:hypothetical protein IX38_10655 [Chryseobacterium luteum]|uniref:RHS repeat-associated core domain-containing protein n=2 Tax=Chryseobacterium luteum TaxID=421531 RepID=A0A085ZHE6_9FLAO|nr:hypothetical protein IX38_10655 [Chryseobacterium luteum]